MKVSNFMMFSLYIIIVIMLFIATIMELGVYALLGWIFVIILTIILYKFGDREIKFK